MRFLLNHEETKGAKGHEGKAGRLSVLGLGVFLGVLFSFLTLPLDKSS